MLHFVQIQITPLIFGPLKRAFFLLNVAFYALRRAICYSQVAQKREIFKFLLSQISVDFREFLPESPKFLEFNRKLNLFKISKFNVVKLNKSEGFALTLFQHRICEI